MSPPRSEYEFYFPTWATALVIFLVLIGLFAWASRSLVRGGMSKAAETKQNLHQIQLALERYAVDFDGQYPLYLIGGEARYREVTGRSKSGPVYSDETHACPDLAGVSDALLREGYLAEYPRNPFARDGREARRWQEKLPSSITGDDPLRSGTEEARLLGTRFGADGTAMGQVLCDPRFEEWACYACGQGKPEYRETWAIVEYDFFDQWTGGKKPKPYLPGEFFYKSIPYEWHRSRYMPDPAPSMRAFMNRHKALDGATLGPISYPRERNLGYALGAYGSMKAEGQDILGPERLQRYPAAKKAPPWQYWPTWTRSRYNLNATDGSPFYLEQINAAGYLAYRGEVNGNRNGVPDGILIFLTSGIDY